MRETDQAIHSLYEFSKRGRILLEKGGKMTFRNERMLRSVLNVPSEFRPEALASSRDVEILQSGIGVVTEFVWNQGVLLKSGNARFKSTGDYHLLVEEEGSNEPRLIVDGKHYIGSKKLLIGYHRSGGPYVESAFDYNGTYIFEILEEGPERNSESLLYTSSYQEIYDITATEAHILNGIFNGVRSRMITRC